MTSGETTHAILAVLPTLTDHDLGRIYDVSLDIMRERSEASTDSMQCALFETVAA